MAFVRYWCNAYDQEEEEEDGQGIYIYIYIVSPVAIHTHRPPAETRLWEAAKPNGGQTSET